MGRNRGRKGGCDYARCALLAQVVTESLSLLEPQTDFTRAARPPSSSQQWWGLHELAGGRGALSPGRLAARYSPDEGDGGENLHGTCLPAAPAPGEVASSNSFTGAAAAAAASAWSTPYLFCAS